MKISLGCDHGGYQLKEAIKTHLEKKGHEILDFGCYSTESVNYPEFGKKAASAVVKKEADRGIVICGTGIGISIAANKVKGVRAALCTNTTMARLTREHNDANVLALGARMIGDVLALEMVDVFLETQFEGGRHQDRIDLLEHKCTCK